MSKFEMFGIVFIVSFVLVFIGDYFFLSKPKLRILYEGENIKSKKKTKKKQKQVEVGELNYLVSKFKLDQKKLNWKNLAIMFALINAFIMAFVVAILEFVSGEFYIKLPIAFVLIFALIYSLYEIYGRYLKNKQERERD